MEIPEGGKREKGTEEMLETTMVENFLKLMSDNQNTDPGRSENTKHDKCQ